MVTRHGRAISNIDPQQKRKETFLLESHCWFSVKLAHAQKWKKIGRGWRSVGGAAEGSHDPPPGGVVGNLWCSKHAKKIVFLMELELVSSVAGPRALSPHHSGLFTMRGPWSFSRLMSKIAPLDAMLNFDADVKRKRPRVTNLKTAIVMTACTNRVGTLMDAEQSPSQCIQVCTMRLTGWRWGGARRGRGSGPCGSTAQTVSSRGFSYRQIFLTLASKF